MRRHGPQNGYSRNDYQCQQSPQQHTSHGELETPVGGAENFNIGPISACICILKKPTTWRIRKMKNCIRHGRYKGSSRVNTLTCITCLPPRVMLSVTRNKMQRIDRIINTRRLDMYPTIMTFHSTRLSSLEDTRQDTRYKKL